jgi:predicted pyridoxine 5'-phosphate oxidase superfamily flavin-nucleotide-binding protein
LLDNLKHRGEVGVLAIEFETRRRMRLNGRAEVSGAGVIHVRSEQVYSNCPRYIHEREVVAHESAIAARPSVHRFSELTGEHRRWISQSDTFFIATFHAEGGADASHRGGDPGFVRADGDRTLLWPDYQGNSMFNTLGNIHDHPAAGLLFVNFEEGHTLQLSGSARVIWDATRLVEFRVAEVIETRNATPLRWRPVDGGEKVFQDES